MVRIGKATALLIAVLQFSACAAQQKLQKAANQNILEVNYLSGAHIGIHVFDPSTNTNLFSSLSIFRLGVFVSTSDLCRILVL